MRHYLFLPFTGILAVHTAAQAQTPSDLSGTWSATKDVPSSVAAAPNAVLGAQFALKQEGTKLTFVRRIRDLNVGSTYELGGGEVRTRIPGGLCMGESESIETVSWDGKALVLTVVGTVPPGGGTVNKLNIRRVLRLQTPDSLLVEAAVRDKAQAEPRTVGTVYRRSSEPMIASAPSAVPKVAARIAQVGWMAGEWTAASGSEERWSTPAGGSMLAVSRTLRNGVMTAFEFLCIVERAGGLVYQAMPNGRMPATDFTLTAIEANSATFENAAHDFPKMIRYMLRTDGTLEAVISGDPKQPSITFTFKKQP
jgi:hypothetical protein